MGQHDECQLRTNTQKRKRRRPKAETDQRRARLSAQENDALKVLAPVVPTRIKPSMRDALNSPDEIVHCQGNFAAADRIDVVGIEFDNTANLRWFFHRLSPVF